MKSVILGLLLFGMIMFAGCSTPKDVDTTTSSTSTQDDRTSYNAGNPQNIENDSAQTTPDLKGKCEVKESFKNAFLDVEEIKTLINKPEYEYKLRNVITNTYGGDYALWCAVSYDMNVPASKKIGPEILVDYTVSSCCSKFDGTNYIEISYPDLLKRKKTFRFPALQLEMPLETSATRNIEELTLFGNDALYMKDTRKYADSSVSHYIISKKGDDLVEVYVDDYEKIITKEEVIKIAEAVASRLQ